MHSNKKEKESSPAPAPSRRDLLLQECDKELMVHGIGPELYSDHSVSHYRELFLMDPWISFQSRLAVLRDEARIYKFTINPKLLKDPKGEGSRVSNSSKTRQKTKAYQTMLRYRAEFFRAKSAMGRAKHFRILVAIAELIPQDADVDGKASGVLGIRDISKRAGMSGAAVRRALSYWYHWKMLGLHSPGTRTREIRFERAFVEQVLATKGDHGKIELVLLDNRAKRAADPWPRAPKPTTGAETKELEVAA